MGLASRWTFRFTVWSQTSHFRGGYSWEDVRKLCFCVYEAGKKHMSFENCCEWAGGKRILLKAPPRVLSKSPGCNPMSSPSIRRMKRQGYFWMIQNVFQGCDLLALCGVPLYRKHENDFPKLQFCTHLRKLCKTITWYLFSCLPDGNRAVTSNSAGLIPVFDYKSKKRFGLPPMKAHGWNFCWKSPLAPRWNPMLGYPLQCGNLSVYAPRAKQWCHYRCNFTKWKQNIQCPFWFLLSGITWYWPFDSWQPVVFTSIGKCNFSLRNLILIFRWHAGFD